MPFNPIAPPVESLVAESASIGTIAEYFSQELTDIISECECSSAVVERLSQIILVADAITEAFE